MDTNHPPASKGFYYGWIVVVVCFIISLISYGVRFSFGVFFKPLAIDFDLNRTTTSGIMSLYMLLSAAFAIISGWFLDRYGPKKVTAIMALFIGLSLLFASRATAAWHLYLSYGLLLAMGTGGVFTVIIATTSRWFVKRRGLAIALVTSSVGIGMVIIPVVAYLISDSGWRVSYLILSLVGFAAIPIALALKLPDRKVLVSIEGEVPGTTLSTHGYASDSDSLYTIIMSRNFWFFLSSALAIAFCIFIIIAHAVPYAIDMGIPSTTASTTMSLIGGLSILGRVVIGRISDSVGRKATGIVSTMLAALSMLLLIWASDLWRLYLFAVVFGFAWGGMNASFAALMADIFGLRHLGVMVGIVDCGYGIGGALGPIFAGYLFDVTGRYTFGFLGGALVMLIAAILVVFLRLPAEVKRIEQKG